MNYKELQQIAKEVGAVVDVPMLGRHDNTVFTTGELERFAEALIAEVAKQNEPVAYRWKEKGRWLSWYVDWTWHDKAKSLGFPVEYAYTYQPTAEQIANETAEAIAKYCRNQDLHCLAAEIESGEWKEFKK